MIENAKPGINIIETMPNAHVIGIGKSGNAAARLLKKEKWQVTVSDRSTSDNLQEQAKKLISEDIEVLLGHTFNPDTEKNQPSLIVVSPGVPWDIPALIRARELGIETIGEMELAWRHLQNRPWVGITGTNGKTTTTALISAIFQAAGFYAPACGNIGYAACELALAEKEPDWVIAEISSYQIESSDTLSPRIGVWTTFTPDHLARHQTLENYYNIKAKLLTKSQLQIFNGDDAYLQQIGLSQWPDACWTSIKGKDNLICDRLWGVYIEDGWVIAQGDRVVEVSALKMVGEHNQQNLLMAVAAAKMAGIENEAIATAIDRFPGVSHRLEHICTWQAIDFINDSKATNYDAAEVGLNSINSPAILIAGGEAKAGDDTGWLKAIQTKTVAVLLIGDAAPAFAKRLEDISYSRYEIVETMDKAITRATQLAPQINARVVLLSPACASFDQYQNFEERGDHFRNLCLEKLSYQH